MRIEILAFARMRELLGAAQVELQLPPGARVRDAWRALVDATPALGELTASTRIARNATVASLDERLADGDRLALLPPVGGG